MVDEILTLKALLGVLVVAFSCASVTRNCKHVFSVEWTTALKGVCCIIVILVHIPQAYSTKIQDLAGSFAYIAVTFFFLFSGYGLTISKEKKGYLEHFWRNRMVSLLVPMLVVNVLNLCSARMMGSKGALLRTLFNIDGFVLMITLCYVVFYAVYSLRINKRQRIVGLGSIIMGISACTYLFEDFFPFTVWPVPCIGFIYGVFFAEYKDRIITHLEKSKVFDREMWFILCLSILIGGGVHQGKENSLHWRLCVEGYTCITCNPVRNKGIVSD